MYSIYKAENSIYEPETTRLFHEYLHRGDKCVIAGAHRGYFATMASALVGSTGMVYTFEPEPLNFSILKENTEGLSNIRLHNFALGEKEQQAKFYFNSDNDGGHALYDPRVYITNVKTHENPISFMVDVKRLDDVLEDEDLSTLKLMLFDVEGAEHSLLKGAINTIVDMQVPYIITEINNAGMSVCGTSQMALRSYMETYGYRAYLMDENGVSLIDPAKQVSVKSGDLDVVFNILFKHFTAK
jgi:FkbM family methyltransferase